MDVCLFFSVLCCPVYVEALRRADPPSKESYQLSTDPQVKTPRHRKVKTGRLGKKERQNGNIHRILDGQTIC
jgi:hypothetical protein